MSATHRKRRFRNCWERPRREMCELVGRRMKALGSMAAANAWYELGSHVESLGDRDIPKFIDLITAMRAYTIRYQGIASTLKAKGWEIP